MAAEAVALLVLAVILFGIVFGAGFVFGRLSVTKKDE